MIYKHITIVLYIFELYSEAISETFISTSEVTLFDRELIYT